MFLKKNYGVLYVLFFCGAVFSQERQLQKANIAFENQAYADAKKMYLKALEKGEQSKELYERLGDSYYHTGDIETAVQWYQVLLSMYPDGVSEEYYNKYVEGLKNVGNNKTYHVVPLFYVYDHSNPDEKLGYATLAIPDDTDKSTKNFIIEKLRINSKYSDYAPSFYKDKLVFASSRNSRSFSKVLHGWNNYPFLDLYTTTKTNNTYHVKKLKGDINTKFHESSATFSKDRKTVYFTRNNYSRKKSKTNKDGVVLLKIYKATCTSGKWKNIKEVPFNSDEYSIAHPALSPDGRYLYFASDMRGSHGKSDLYVVEIDEHGNFGTPQNLGDKINTPGRETFPFVSDKGRLFFASDGHDGMGGLDIFVVVPDKDGNIEVRNLGEPVNSTKDDFTFIVNEERKMGYFASNRKGGKGDDDIYRFKQLTPFNELPKQGKSKKKLERVIDLKPTKNETTSL